MELRQLEYLVAVVDSGGFTRAAECLHVAQPGVSAQIRRLEAELGEELLERAPRGVRPTAAGAALLPHARAALDAVAGAREAVQELRGLVRGQVSVGVVTACPAIELTDLLAAFHRAHPGVEVTLREEGSDRLVAALHEGRLDLAVIGSHGPPLPGLATLTLADETLVAAVAPGDPLLAGRGRAAASPAASAPTAPAPAAPAPAAPAPAAPAPAPAAPAASAPPAAVPLAALRERGLVVLPRGTGIRAALEDGCARAGFAPRVAFEASSPAMLASLARAGLGVAIVAASMAAADPLLHAVALTRPALRSRLELAWRAEGPSSPAARALTAHLREGLTPAEPVPA
jgi:DNA-binding transcriptional LysR family regulator